MTYKKPTAEFEVNLATANMEQETRVKNVGWAQSNVRDIQIKPTVGTVGVQSEAETFVASSVAEAVAAIRRQGGARVVYMEMTHAIQNAFEGTRIEPAKSGKHMLKQKNKEGVEALTTTFNEAIKKGKWKEADDCLRAMSKLAPGLHDRNMLHHYTNPIHHAVMEHPEIHTLFKLLYGQDYRYLHNRMSFRYKDGPLAVKDASLHREGDEGELGYIFCLAGERYFCCMPNERKEPLAGPGSLRFRSIQREELSDPLAHEVVSLNVQIPDGQVALIMFDHYMPHGIDSRGKGIQLYLSACNQEKLEELDRSRSDMLKKGTWQQAHDPIMREASMRYGETVTLALLFGGVGA